MGVYCELSSHPHNCLLKTLCSSYRLCLRNHPTNGLKQQPFYLLMILWVDNLGWAQLGGSSVGFSWGHSHHFSSLVTQVRWMVQNGFPHMSGCWCLEPAGKPAATPYDSSSSSRLTWASSCSRLREAKEGRPQDASVYFTFAIDLLVKLNYTTKPRVKGLRNKLSHNGRKGKIILYVKKTYMDCGFFFFFFFCNLFYFILTSNSTYAF